MCSDCRTARSHQFPRQREPRAVGLYKEERPHKEKHVAAGVVGDFAARKKKIHAMAAWITVDINV